MVHLPPWFWFAMITILAWGIVGLLQKLSTNFISAESSLIWLGVGFLLFEPLVYPGKTLFSYSNLNITWALVSGVLNALGAWALFAALKSGGKASIVAPLTALYPLVVHESITRLQVVGVVCALVAVVCLSVESAPSETSRGPGLDETCNGKLLER
jgi:transporter family protein